MRKQGAEQVGELDWIGNLFHRLRTCWGMTANKLSLLCRGRGSELTAGTCDRRPSKLDMALKGW